MRALREHRICRLCLSTGCCLIDILEESRNDEFVVKQAVEDLLQLVVVREALHPWLVCSICLEKLREFYFFKRSCVESQEVYDCRIRGNSWPVNQLGSTDCDVIPLMSEGHAIEDPLHCDAFKNIDSDHSNQPVAEDLRFDSKVTVKCEEDGSTWESMELDSHNPTDYNSFEVTQSATGHDSDFDIPIETEEENAVEDPLHHDACKNMDSDHSSQPSSEFLSIDSNVNVKPEEIEEVDVQGKGPFSIESDLSSKSNIGDVSIHYAEFESSGSEKDGTGSGASEKGHEAVSEQDAVSRFAPSLVVVEELDIVSNPAKAFGGMDASKRGTETAMSGSGRSRSIGQGGSSSCFGRRIVREKFICVECGATYVSKLTLSSHVRAHLSRNEDIGSAKGREQAQENEHGTSFLQIKYDEVIGAGCDLSRERFICDHCGKAFTRKYQMISHMCSVHLNEFDVESTAGELCGKGSKRGSVLKVQMQKDLEKSPLPCTRCPRSFNYTCDVCAKDFKGKPKLRKHIQRHSDERLFKCQECSKAFKTHGGLKQHSLVHSRLLKYSCEVCGKKFSRSGHLSSHMITHDGKKPFECELCHKKFSRRGDLTIHMRTHDGKRPFECKLCHKMFYRSGHLSSHMRTHDGKRPFECELCHKKFSQSGTLSTHMGTHDGNRAFECERCHKKFSQSSYLRRHMRTHDGMRPYECQLCHKKFSQSGTLSTHMGTHDGNRAFECERCHKKFSQSSNLRRHMRTHDGMRPYECQLCHKKFSQSGTLSTHMGTHDGNRAFECERCHKKFSQSSNLRRHMRTHDGMRPYECQLCHKKFSQSGHLRIHMRNHYNEAVRV